MLTLERVVAVLLKFITGAQHSIHHSLPNEDVRVSFEFLGENFSKACSTPICMVCIQNLETPKTSWNTEKTKARWLDIALFKSALTVYGSRS